MKKKRILLGASYSVIEPLGLLHLGGLARDMKWDRKFHLVKDHDFETLFEKVRDFKPDIVGFNVYTGNHLQLHEAFGRLKKDHPEVTTVVGGPHATYFPAESAKYADFVVMSEGFGSLRKILSGEAKKGILPMLGKERFPHPDRQTFYDDYPEHAKSRIKSIITMTGCPYECTYCYNSSTPKDIADNLTPEIAEKLGKAMGMGERLFPHNIRTVEDVVAEGREIIENWPTEVVYSQDDVHGFDINNWMPQFAKSWPEEVGIPYHAQMRWEMTTRESGKRRLDLVKEAGGFGLTLAIEAADADIRKEVLARAMPEETMFEGMKAVIERGFKVRTEQITGLPYGATSNPTPMNLDADIGLIELNVNLREEAGGPTMAWASTLAPYKGTKLGAYCERFGHYHGNNHDVPDNFFDRSVLQFPREWIGPDLENRKEDPSVWLSENELEKYRNQNAELRRHFNFFALVPKGHLLAREYLTRDKPIGYKRLGAETRVHLENLSARDLDASRMLEKIGLVEQNIGKISTSVEEENLRKSMEELAPYFAVLPESRLAMERAVEYSRKQSQIDQLDSKILSTAVRHHLYDNVLYSLKNSQDRIENRYPSKI